VGLSRVGGSEDRRQARRGTAGGTIAHVVKVAIANGEGKADRPWTAVNAKLGWSRTGPKRIMTESVTSPDSAFVPYDIW
jgi:hypothetical protein